MKREREISREMYWEKQKKKEKEKKDKREWALTSLERKWGGKGR